MGRRTATALALALVALVAPPASATDDAGGYVVGAFGGTLAQRSPCTARTELAIDIRAEVVSAAYAGPLTITGKGTYPVCTSVVLGGSMYTVVRATGGTRLHCPELRGLAVGGGRWTMGLAPAPDRPCTLDGRPLDDFHAWLDGWHVPTGTDTAAVAGWLFVGTQ